MFEFLRHSITPSINDAVYVSLMKLLHLMFFWPNNSQDSVISTFSKSLPKARTMVCFCLAPFCCPGQPLETRTLVLMTINSLFTFLNICHLGFPSQYVRINWKTVSDKIFCIGSARNKQTNNKPSKWLKSIKTCFGLKIENKKIYIQLWRRDSAPPSFLASLIFL